MPDQVDRIADLTLKYLNGSLSPDEAIELDKWKTESAENFKRFQDRINNKAILENIVHYQKAESEKEETRARIAWERLSNESTFVKKPSSYWRKLSVAAAIFAVLVSITLFWIGHSKNAGAVAQDIRDNSLRKDILPGRNMAYLVLSDGSRIALDSAHDGIIGIQGKSKVIKESNGQLAYEKNSLIKSSEKVTYNILETPNSAQFQVVLPDGTRVWLNNASSLRYPTVFSDTIREIELTGEAYFEVAKVDLPGADGRKSKVPFIVDILSSPGGIGGSQIEVLGTHFNIMSYEDEDAVKTTLLEGSVKVTKGSNSVIIKPGEQAQLISNSANSRQAESIKVVKDVDVERTVAWKNGYFHFDKADIKAVMRQLARWYDVDVQYEGAISNHRFDGRIQRNLLLSELLKDIESSGVHFKMESRKITVTP